MFSFSYYITTMLKITQSYLEVVPEIIDKDHDKIPGRRSHVQNARNQPHATHTTHAYTNISLLTWYFILICENNVGKMTANFRRHMGQISHRLKHEWTIVYDMHNINRQHLDQILSTILMFLLDWPIKGQTFPTTVDIRIWHITCCRVLESTHEYVNITC